LVAKEIIIAFDNKIPIIPVLVNGAKMPDSNSLADTLKPLADINALELSDSRWKYDTVRLINRLSHISGKEIDKKKWFMVIAVILIVSVTTYFLVEKKRQQDHVNTDLPDTNIVTADRTDKESEIPRDNSPKKPIDIVGAGFTANAFSQYI